MIILLPACNNVLSPLFLNVAPLGHVGPKDPKDLAGLKDHVVIVVLKGLAANVVLLDHVVIAVLKDLAVNVVLLDHVDLKGLKGLAVNVALLDHVDQEDNAVNAGLLENVALWDVLVKLDLQALKDLSESQVLQEPLENKARKDL